MVSCRSDSMTVGVTYSRIDTLPEYLQCKLTFKKLDTLACLL